MPFKSKAQRRKFAQLLVEGKITDETYEEWNRSTGRKVLPERVTPKDRARRRKRAKPGPKAKGRTGTKAKSRTRPKARKRARARRKAK
jgi:hypothetical protein